MKYLWDTNTVIYFLQNQFNASAQKFIDASLTISPPAISSITEIELMCWRAPKEKDFEIIQNFISEATIIELENPIKLKTVEIRKNLGIKLPDAVIAATAITNNLILITRNIKDFHKIQELDIINPFTQ